MKASPEDTLQAAAGTAWTTVLERPRVWGLAAAEVLDSWWRSQGVQWVRRGEGAAIRGQADLYLLTEPEQGVMFDLRLLVPSLTWNRPSVTRIRLISERGDDYRERIVTGDRGGVIGIRREYWRETAGSQRLILTASATIARRWSQAADRRAAWLELRGSGSWSRSDHHRIQGESFRIGEAAQEGLLLSEIIGRWSDPDRAVDGISMVAPGVWMLEGDRPSETDVLVGPAWIGTRVEGSEPLRVVGPAWSADAAEPSTPARTIEIGEVREAHRSVATRAAGSSEIRYDAIKRLIDVGASLTGLIVLSPILLAVAVAVLVDDGWPIVFGHERQTRAGRSFRCLKFRTMRRGAEALAEKYRKQNVCDGPQVYIADDPRVTRVGRVLRKYHLDELLQLVNVLSGDMSLVGPRPSPDRENRLCPAWRDARLSVRPGITGLWQVCRTRQPGLDFQEWIQFDTQYVKSRSLSLDCWIIWRTLRGLAAKETQDGVVETNPA
jgi:lipopolysaccharide/colanic/teichoic acid biosynthesis glycosyltransferase